MEKLQKSFCEASITLIVNVDNAKMLLINTTYEYWCKHPIKCW